MQEYVFVVDNLTSNSYINNPLGIVIVRKVLIVKAEIVDKNEH